MDDFQIYTRVSPINLDDAVNTTNADLDKICKWSNTFGLKINLSKTLVIIVGTSRMLFKIDWTKLPQVTCNNSTPILYSERVKNLGILIANTLSRCPRLPELSRKMFATEGLPRLRNFLPLSTKIFHNPFFSPSLIIKLKKGLIPVILISLKTN